MKNFLLIPNRQKDTGLALTGHIRDTLIEMGAVCHIYDGYYNDVSPIQVPENTECILVIGGDGTILADPGFSCRCGFKRTAGDAQRSGGRQV